MPGFDLKRYGKVVFVKRVRTLLVIIAIVALVWLGRSFISTDTVSPVTLLLILGLLLAALFFRKISRNSKREVELPPSQRKKTKEHKSWISRIDQD